MYLEKDVFTILTMPEVDIFSVVEMSLFLVSIFLHFPVIFFFPFYCLLPLSPSASSFSNFSSIWGRLLLCSRGFCFFLPTSALTEAPSFLWPPASSSSLLELWLSSVLPPPLHLAQPLRCQASLDCWMSLWQPTVSGPRRHRAEPKPARRDTM